jgi:DNA polymerase-1
LAKQSAKQQVNAYLVTGDKDFMQLVDESIFIYNTGKGDKIEMLDSAGVKEKIGLPPNRVIDFLALMGDTSDNVPGVPKIGEKTALELLLQYDTLENLLAKADEIKRAAVRQSLQENRDLALLSKKLVTIETNVPLPIKLDDFAFRGMDATAAAALCREFEFNSLVPRFTITTAETAKGKYELLNTPARVEWLAQQLAQVDSFAFDTETTAEDPLRAELVGMSFSWEEGAGSYIPVAPPRAKNDLTDFFLQNSDLSLKTLFAPLLEDPRRPKCGQNAKYDMLVMSRYGVKMAGVVFDTMIASYLLNPTSRQHNLDALAMEHFNYKKIPTSELIGKGKAQITMRDVPVETVSRYACEDADFTWRLRNHFLPKLRGTGLEDLFEKVEMPLVAVLAEVEKAGVKLDLPFLKICQPSWKRRSAR